MSQPGRCPFCGSPAGDTTGPGGPGAGRGLDPLYREVRRIREIAETRAADSDARRAAADSDARRAADDARRIADLTRQVHDLRATVARLRGAGVPFVAAPPGESPGRRGSTRTGAGAQ